MRLTVLGKSPAWQDAGGACSGYLVEEGDTALVVDCGNGVFGKLRDHVDYTRVEAVAISHMHADHFFDLFPFAYGLLLTPRQQPVPVAGWPGTQTPARPRLIVPVGGRSTLRATSGTWGDEGLVEGAFRLEEYQEHDVVEVGPFSLRFAEVPHYIPTFAIDVTGPGGERITFGADCCPNDALVEFARDTDLLVVEATLPRPERTGIRGHLTPEEAGEHARRAGAKRALLTHVSDELDPEWVAAEGAKGFGAAVAVASEGATFEI
jgi:ribonuclease BN (tRNA processing enzyme)